MKDYVYNYEVLVRLHTVDDSRDTFFTTRMLVDSTYNIYNARNAAFPTILNIRYSRTATKGEPMILSIKNEMQRFLGWGSRGYANAPKEFSVRFKFPDAPFPDGTPATFIVNKTNPYYNLMGNRMTKRNLMIALSRGMYRSCFEKNGLVLTEYVFKMITLPENVSYVLENRTPYWFFMPDESTKTEVRLNTKLIGSDECAIEISDGVWAPISVKDLDIFINYFYHGHSRAKKWAYKSPKKLWHILMGEYPTESQEKLMMEFLSQNRTQELVENRAKELMQSLTKKFPNRIKLFDVKGESGNSHTIMCIRGKLCDWAIIDSAYKTNIQKVKTYAFITEEAANIQMKDADERITYLSRRHNGNSFENGNLRGPICIDNIHDNSSVGDQYAARALALLNDEVTLKLVYTIAKYIPEEVREGVIDSRFKDWASLGPDSPWKVII
tara:strand:+ start:339 stop:1658 length:1320 start_codon:yes stop_codon:yes gene_type:complete